MLSTILDRVREDVRTAVETDPAAKRPAEALLYPGLHAVWGHRLAHWLWTRDVRLTARAWSHVVRFLTGVEIHPAATLGRRVFIDHGMGVVIGETAEVGDDVHMFHGVTLGGNDPRPVKRHPTVEDGVTLGANATLVGDVTVGEGATVGAGAVVVDDVPPETTVAGNPATPTGDSTTAAPDGASAPGDDTDRVPPTDDDAGSTSETVEGIRDGEETGLDGDCGDRICS